MLRAMRRSLYVLVVIGCSASPRNKVPVDQPPGFGEPPPATPAATTTQDPPAAQKPVVDAKPDPAKRDAREVELGQLAAAYMDAFVNSNVVFTPDRKRVVFQSNRDGIPQLYVGDVSKPGATPARLVTTTERTVLDKISSDGKAALFRTDTGADENWSFYRVDLDGKNLVELTQGEKLNRGPAIFPDQGGDTFFFSARKMSEARSTIYSASAKTPGPAKALYTDELPAFLNDVDAKGATALVTQFPMRIENYLLRLDIATGKAEKLFPAEGKVSIFDAKFSPDGKTVYVATDGGTEENVLLALDTKSGKQLAKYALKPPTAQIQGIEVAKRGGLLALTIVAGDHSEIVLLDGKLKVKQTPKLPLGAGGVAEFSEDGKRLALAWSTPDKPSDLFAIDVANGKVSKLRDEPRPTLANMPKIKTTIVEVPAFDGGKIPTLVYVKDGEEQKPHPTLVIYHGGPSGVSMVRWSPSTAFFVSLGYAVVEPNVRGSSGYGRGFEAGDNGKKRLDAFRDIEASARWVSQQPFADKNKLVVYGGSYGGYTTLVALSRWPDIWAAGVNLFGVVNLKTFMATTSGLIRKIFLDEFGDPDKDAEFLAQISPLSDVDKIVDPTFVYAGANDPRVPRSESDIIVKALRERRVPSEYMVSDNEGHSLARRENQIEYYGRVARFLETHVK